MNDPSCERRPDAAAARAGGRRRNLSRFARNAMQVDAMMARTLGIHVTDLASIDLLSRSEEPVSPKQLANHLGVSTGSATNAIDRLEKAGLVRRVHNPKDRRGVFIAPIEGKFDDGARACQRVDDRLQEILGRFSDDELQVVNRFMSAFSGYFLPQHRRLGRSGRDCRHALICDAESNACPAG